MLKWSPANTQGEADQGHRLVYDYHGRPSLLHRSRWAAKHCAYYVLVREYTHHSMVSAGCFQHSMSVSSIAVLPAASHDLSVYGHDARRCSAGKALLHSFRRDYCAGFTARGMVYFQSAGWFGYYGYPNDARPWQNKQLWDWSGCCSMDVQKNRFFGLVAALFGYTVRPETTCR